MKGLRKIWTAVQYAVGIGLFLALVIGGFTQSKFFRERLRTYLLSTLEDNIRGEVRFGAITGNLITNLSVSDLQVRLHGEDVFRARGLTVRYDALQLLRNKISVRNLIIDAPELTLRRFVDNRWNIEHLLPERQDSVRVPSEPSEPWALEVRGVEIRDGVFLVLDSLDHGHRGSGDGTFSFSQFAMLGLNAQVSGEVSEDVVRLKILRMAFQLPQADVRIERVEGGVEIGSDFATVEELVVESGRSRLKLNGRVDRIDLSNLALASLEKSPTVVDLEVERIDFNELKTFIPALSFLEGSASAHLVTGGTFGQLTVEKLDLNTTRTFLHFEGTVSNLHQPKGLQLAINSYDNVVDPKEVVELLPRFSIPDYGHLGRLRLDLQFSGSPLVFDSRVVLRSIGGDLEGDLHFDFSKLVAEYRGSVKTRGLDAGKIFQDDNLTGQITMAAAVDGRGFGLESINSSFRVEVDTSQMFGLTFDAARLTIEARERIFDITLLLRSQMSRLGIEGEVDFHHPDSTAYDFEASFTSLDLSKILKDSKHVSNLSFLLRGSGGGTSLEELNGEFTLSLYPSVYRDRAINGTDATLTFDQPDPQHRAISLRSDVIDADVEGTFDVRWVVDIIEKNTELLLRIVEQKLAPFDSVFAHPHPKLGPVIRHDNGFEVSVESRAPEVFDLKFRTSIKDLEPVAVFLGGEQFDGRADFSGTIAGSSDQLAVSLNGFIEDFFYGSARQGVFVGKLDLHAGFEGLSPVMETRDLRSSLSVAGKSLFVNRTEFSDLALDLSFAEELSRISVRTVIDSVFFVDLTGHATFGEKPYRFVFDSVRFGSGEYEWRNESPLIASLDNMRLSVEQVAFVRGSERARFAGSLGHNDVVDFHGDLPNFDLGSLIATLQREQLGLRRSLQGRAQLSFALSGALESPVITAQLGLDSLSYRGISLGGMRSAVSYRERLAALDVEFLKDASSTRDPELSLKGTLPIDLSLGASAEVERGRFPDEPMDLTLKARGFHLAFLDPLIASFDDIRGTVSGDIKIEGTPRSPLYSGSIVTENSQFLFVPNRLNYTVNATLQPERENIRIVSMEIKNDLKDRPDGIVFVTGTLSLREFSISSFDLAAQGQLLVLSERTPRLVQEIQGNLFASIGPEGLHYAGTFEQSRLTGTILIDRASLLFPGLQQSAYVTSPTSLNYAVIDDTSGVEAGTSSLEVYHREEDALGIQRGAQNGNPGRTILDGISYDVQVETKGDVKIQMIFNAFTGEELYAVLNGKLALVKDGPQTQLIGEVAVVERSYYAFYKKFDAVGKLRFTGDAENPELNIRAQYRGRYNGPTTEHPDKLENLSVLVDLTISGTRYQPKLEVGLVVSDSAGNVVTPLALSDPHADAISYILVGKLKNDLTSRDRNSVSGQVGLPIQTSLVTGFASTMLSEVLTDFVRKEISFIRTVELSYRDAGSPLESADLRLSGEVFNAYWRFGGRILTDPTNANVSVQLSMGEVFNSTHLRNLMLELERSIRDIQFPTQDRDTYGAKLYYRITF